MVGPQVPEVTLSGTVYPVPDLAIDQLRVVFPAIMRWQSALIDPSKFTEQNYDDLILAVYYGAVARNNPALSLVEFAKKAVPHYELMAALEIVQRQTHLFRPVKEAVGAGEASATDSTGTNS